MESLKTLLQQIESTGIGYVADFDFSDPQRLDCSLAGPYESSLTPIAGNKAGCVLATYSRNPGNSFWEQPIVWLDSEGYPNGIFARDFPAFLSLIPYGSGWVYDQLYDCLQAYEAGKLPGAGNGLAPPEPCSGPEAEAYLHWLAMQSLQRAENPAQVIQQAFLLEPGFQQTLNQFFTEK